MILVVFSKVSSLSDTVRLSVSYPQSHPLGVTRALKIFYRLSFNSLSNKSPIFDLTVWLDLDRACQYLPKTLSHGVIP